MYEAILSDQQIIDEAEKGNILIYRPDGQSWFDQVGNCSFDVTLGEYYYEEQKFPGEVFNPTKPEDVHNYWGPVQKAQVASEREYGLEKNQRYIIIPPKRTILAHTQEFIGGRNHITTMLRARSSMARANISICGDAGWGDIGYINRWTMQIRNHGYFPIILTVGQRVGQIIFLYIGRTFRSYQSKYQEEVDIKKLAAVWQPRDMLPKLMLDVENQK